MPFSARSFARSRSRLKETRKITKMMAHMIMGIQLYMKRMAVSTAAGWGMPCTSYSPLKPAPDITQPNTAVPRPRSSFWAAEVPALPMPTALTPVLSWP